MSISSNSKLKAAFTWYGQTTPAVALFSRPTRLSSSRWARVILRRRWQPAMAHLIWTFPAISPMLQRPGKETVRTCLPDVQPHPLLPARSYGAEAGMAGVELARVREVLRLPRRGRGGRMESAETAPRRAALDLAIIGILADGGLRRSEAAALTWGDVEL